MGWESFGGAENGGGISDNPTSSREPSMAVDAEGNIVVAWSNVTEGSSGFNRDIYVRRWDGNSWTAYPKPDVNVPGSSPGD